MANEHAVPIGAYLLAALLFALPSTQISFAEGGHPQDSDRVPRSTSGQEGGSAAIPSDHSADRPTKPDESSLQNAVDAPAKTDANAPPSAQQGIATPDAPREHKGEVEHLQQGDAKSTVTSPGAKNGPGVNGPTKESGSDTHLALPTELPVNKLNETHPGKKPFKIVTPKELHLRHAPAAGASGIPSRNAIGMSIAPNNLAHGANGESGGRPAPGAPAVAAKGPTVSPVSNPNAPTGGTHSLVPTPPNAERIGSAGSIRPELARTGVGGPAKTSAGIDGNSFRIKR